MDAGSGAVPQQRRGGSRPAERSPRTRGTAPGPGGGGAFAGSRAGRRLRFPPRGAAAALALGTEVSPGPRLGPPGPAGRAWRPLPRPTCPSWSSASLGAQGYGFVPVTFLSWRFLVEIKVWPMLVPGACHCCLSADAFIKDISIHSICCWNDPLVCLVQKLNSIPYGGSIACFDLQDKVFNTGPCLILLSSLLIVMPLKQLLTLDSTKYI